MHMPRDHALAMHMRPFAPIDVVGWLYHAEIGQAPQPPPQDSNKCRDIDIFLLVRRAAAAVTQSDQKDALIGLRFIRSEVKMIREFLTDQFPPSDSTPGTHCAHPTRIIVE